jgi:phage tail sheath protein FI
MALYDYPNTPGVKIVENSLLPPSVIQVSTAVPVFLGYTEKGPVNQASRISSLKEFEAQFGKGKSYTFVTTQNGSTHTAAAPVSGTPFFFYEAIRLYFMNGGGACYIISIGDHQSSIDKNDFETAIKTIDKLDEPTLILFPEAANLPLADYGTVANFALSLAETSKDKFVILDSPFNSNLLDSLTDLLDYRQVINGNLSYGASYYPALETTLQYTVDSASVSATQGSVDYNKSMAAIQQVNRVILPPSALMAGVYAKVDREIGVWKAPANLSLQGVIKPVQAISDADQEFLNVDSVTGKSINAIRSFIGKGTLVWGARTLDGNSNEWRYIQVRRLFMTVEESVKKAVSQFVFENNDAKTWAKLNAMVRSYLNGLWKEGALVGAKSEDAYFVEVGLGTTMTTQDILEGRMIVKIGVAAVRPAEFIVLEFSHFINQ